LIQVLRQARPTLDAASVAETLLGLARDVSPSVPQHPRSGIDTHVKALLYLHDHPDASRERAATHASLRDPHLVTRFVRSLIHAGSWAAFAAALQISEEVAPRVLDRRRVLLAELADVLRDHALDNPHQAADHLIALAWPSAHGHVPIIDKYVLALFALQYGHATTLAEASRSAGVTDRSSLARFIRTLRRSGVWAQFAALIGLPPDPAWLSRTAAKPDPLDPTPASEGAAEPAFDAILADIASSVRASDGAMTHAQARLLPPAASPSAAGGASLDQDFGLVVTPTAGMSVADHDLAAASLVSPRLGLRRVGIGGPGWEQAITESRSRGSTADPVLAMIADPTPSRPVLVVMLRNVDGMVWRQDLITGEQERAAGLLVQPDAEVWVMQNAPSDENLHNPEDQTARTDAPALPVTTEPERTPQPQPTQAFPSADRSEPDLLSAIFHSTQFVE
jgi:hypothetical protein